MYLWWWPRWVTEGRCFNSAPVQDLREVVRVDPAGWDELECGHRVATAFPESNAPSGAYRRLCPQCSEGMHRDIFFPRKGGMSYEQARVAKQICNGRPGERACPVRDTCRRYAIEHGIRHGVWGGLSQRERQVIGREERQWREAV